MVKKALTLLTSIIIALPLLMPFNIFADELPQSEIVGVSWNLIDTDISLSSGGNWYTYTYELEVKLKNKYVGVINGTLSYTYSDVQSTSSNPTSKTSTTTKRNYVNGDSFKFNVYISNIGQQFTGNGPMYNCSYLVNNSSTNVTKYEDLNSIESVVNVLNDIYANSSDIEGLSTNQLDELINIVSNTSLANEYLDKLTKIRKWDPPFESVAFINQFLTRNAELYDFNNLNYYNFPIFKLNANDIFIRSLFYNDISYYAIFATNKNIYGSGNNQVLNNYFDLSAFDYNYKSLDTSYFINGPSQKLIYVEFKLKAGSSNQVVNIRNKESDSLIIPIFFGSSLVVKNISTDFALRFGLTNNVLDNLDIIANGTTASQSAAQSTDSANSQLATESNTLFQQENGFKSDMQNAMQNVNNTFRLQDMGTKFVSSAQWVRTQYEQLTNNTPFASLITFSLITGLALILLGKVYK